MSHLIPCPQLRSDSVIFFPQSELRKVRYIEGVYALCWRFTDDLKQGWNDPWTARVSDFKCDNRPVHVDKARRLLRLILPTLLQELSAQPNRIGIIAALGHADTTTQPNARLVQLSQGLIQDHGLKDLTCLLFKQPHEALHRQKNEGDREEQVKDKYQSRPVGEGIEVVLILDDLLTTGTTLDEIGRAVRSAGCNSPIYGFVIAKNESKSFATKHQEEISNEYIPERWAHVWDQ